MNAVGNREEGGRDGGGAERMPAIRIGSQPARLWVGGAVLRKLGWLIVFFRPCRSLRHHSSFQETPAWPSSVVQEDPRL